MITEDYVSFETAKLLEEKGVEGDCEYTGWIGESGNHYFPDDTYLDDDEMIAAQKDRKEFIPLVSLQMAMKWLREIHNLHIMIDCIGAKNYIPTIQFTYFGKDIVVESKTSKIGGNGFDSYELACEAAIKYCLENLV